jgi:hypothetical protein
LEDEIIEENLLEFCARQCQGIGMTIPVTINGEDVEAVIDSGANVTLSF